LVNLGYFWRFCDLGDIKVENKTLNQVYEDLLKIIKEHYNSNDVFLLLGVDHIITYLCIKAVKTSVGGKWGLIYFDLHPDLYKEYEGDLK